MGFIVSIITRIRVLFLVFILSSPVFSMNDLRAAIRNSDVEKFHVLALEEFETKVEAIWNNTQVREEELRKCKTYFEDECVLVKANGRYEVICSSHIDKVINKLQETAKQRLADVAAQPSSVEVTPPDLSAQVMMFQQTLAPQMPPPETLSKDLDQFFSGLDIPTPDLAELEFFTFPPTADLQLEDPSALNPPLPNLSPVRTIEKKKRGRPRKAPAVIRIRKRNLERRGEIIFVAQPATFPGHNNVVPLHVGAIVNEDPSVQRRPRYSDVTAYHFQDSTNTTRTTELFPQPNWELLAPPVNSSTQENVMGRPVHCQEEPMEQVINTRLIAPAHSPGPAEMDILEPVTGHSDSFLAPALSSGRPEMGFGGPIPTSSENLRGTSFLPREVSHGGDTQVELDEGSLLGEAADTILAEQMDNEAECSGLTSKFDGFNKLTLRQKKALLAFWNDVKPRYKIKHIQELQTLRVGIENVSDFRATGSRALFAYLGYFGFEDEEIYNFFLKIAEASGDKGKKSIRYVTLVTHFFKTGIRKSDELKFSNALQKAMKNYYDLVQNEEMVAYQNTMEAGLRDLKILTEKGDKPWK